MPERSAQELCLTHACWSVCSLSLSNLRAVGPPSLTLRLGVGAAGLHRCGVPVAADLSAQVWRLVASGAIYTCPPPPSAFPPARPPRYVSRGCMSGFGQQGRSLCLHLLLALFAVVYLSHSLVCIAFCSCFFFFMPSDPALSS